MASGIACRLYQANLRRIVMLETDHPLAVRRKVSFCEAIWDGTKTVEGITAVSALGPQAAAAAWQQGFIPVIRDPEWKSITAMAPHVVVDAILAKKNLGTTMADAGLVIGLGPGFEAGTDVHLVIETNRGHNLGRVITQGKAAPNTGIPGNIAGFTSERVLRAPCAGIFTSALDIGDSVEADQVIGLVGQQPVTALIGGVLRGLIRNNTHVKNKLKIGDIDPRGDKSYCPMISEKARAIGGSVLEGILRQYLTPAYGEKTWEAPGMVMDYA